MRHTRTDIMGMPISIDIPHATDETLFAAAFARFMEIDERFSTYKEGSEISRFNRGELPERELSDEMREIFALAERTKEETHGYFDMKRPDGTLDPSGVVKGWAIKEVANLLRARGVVDFMIDAAGDIATQGTNELGEEWTIGIRSPFDREEIVKTLQPQGKGIATSGSYIRGAHIYDPHDPTKTLDDVVSLTVVGPDVLEADRFATAAFAMGTDGITFIDGLPGFAGYAIDRSGIATMTRNFLTYVV